MWLTVILLIKANNLFSRAYDLLGFVFDVLMHPMPDDEEDDRDE